MAIFNSFLYVHQAGYQLCKADLIARRADSATGEFVVGAAASRHPRQELGGRERAHQFTPVDTPGLNAPRMGATLKWVCLKMLG